MSEKALRDTDYAYAVGRIRALELKLLTKSDIDTLLSAKSAEDALRALGDKGWDTENVTPDSFESVLTQESEKTWQIIEETVPEPDQFNLLKYKYDFHNLKVALKSIMLRSDNDDYFINSGTCDPAVLKKTVSQKDFKSVPEHLRDAAEECRGYDEYPGGRVGDAHLLQEMRNRDTRGDEDQDERRAYRGEHSRKERLHLRPLARRMQHGRLLHHRHREREYGDRQERGKRCEREDGAYLLWRDVLGNEPHSRRQVHHVPDAQGEEQQNRALREISHRRCLLAGNYTITRLHCAIIGAMKIRDILAEGRPSVSFEVFPPRKDAPFAPVKEAVERLAEERPSFISVTYGASGNAQANTAEVASFVQKCGVPALAHLTCLTATRESIARETAALRAEGIENILCLRGDIPNGVEAPAPGEFAHAVDLVRALKPEGFCLGGACYPERHPECAHMEDDIGYLREKAEAGLDFVTTQMFFDNNIFYRYLSKLRDRGVTVPVIAGIMPVTNGRQIDRICRLSGTYLPSRFKAIVDRYGDRPPAMQAAGVAYATEQIIDLFANGVNAVHVYTMNKPEVAASIMANLRGIL